MALKASKMRGCIDSIPCLSSAVKSCSAWAIASYDLVSPSALSHGGIQDGYERDATSKCSPLFMVLGNGDFHLQANSLRVDAWNNEESGLFAADFVGDGHILDADGNVTPIVDRGADEIVGAWSDFDDHLPVVRDGNSGPRHRSPKRSAAI